LSENSKPSKEGYGRNPEGAVDGVPNKEVLNGEISPDTDELMERMVERENMMEAYRKVVGNKGSAGVDDMTVDDLEAHLTKNWQSIRKALVEGRYIPQPGGKGKRQLGIMADDCNIYVGSQKAGERVLESITGFLL
jgi:hypothetical protein